MPNSNLSIEEKFKQCLDTKYSHCLNTLKEVSKDNRNGNTNTNYIFENQNLVIDFDGKLIRAIKGTERGTMPSGVDMLHITNSEINLVEFKNGIIKYEKNEIKVKAIESLLMLYKLLEKEDLASKFQDLFNLKINLYVVFNNEKSDNLNIGCTYNLRNRIRGKRVEILFRLYPDYETTYFKRVEIVDFDYFKKKYIDVHFPNPTTTDISKTSD
ncbi:hypothetical protein [Fusobacterium ulcerans]|uniref:hypothetical protein n=1 Tax=Fusobacterium ulcerans TaxID=861 RepID=UPI0026DA962C|nr:hypothetical protein [Fusobacterium ulcerans]